ncbi:MAG: HNH endonuclease [Actinomycetota bacterium]
MDVGSIRSLVSRSPLADVAACRAELAAVRSVRGLLGAREVAVTRRLDELAAADPNVFPEHEVAAAAKASSLTKGTNAKERSKTCDDVPQLGDALAAGETTGDRVDAVSRALNGLPESARRRLARWGAELARAAAEQTDREFRSTVERLFHRQQPDGCPADPLERQHFLQAHALLALSEGTAGSGAPDVTVLIDARTLIDGHWHEGTVLDTGTGIGPFGIPVETVRRWASCGTVTPVVVGLDGVRLLLGRETRLANRAQRRALRALYRTCALCDTPFEFTEAHHVHWSTHGGMTDIDNLLPLCRRHHTLAHEGGWTLRLAPDRTLEVRTQGGMVTIHGPPLAWAA